MAKQMVKRKYCDRCPLNKQRPATITRTFGFDQTFWKADLCEQHDDMLTRELYAWGLLGEPVDIGSRGTFGANVEDLRRLADLRAKQTAEDRYFTTAPPISLPHDHKDWIFTHHALERMEERGLDVVDVLWASSKPDVVRPAEDSDKLIHEREPVKVVIEPATKVIVTVGYYTEENRKAVGL